MESSKDNTSMDLKRNYLILNNDPLLRNITESKIIEYILTWGFPFEVNSAQKSVTTDLIKSALDEFIYCGLPHEDSPSKGRLFNPAEVVNFMKWLDLTDQNLFWSKYIVKTHQDLVIALSNKIKVHQSTDLYQFKFHLARTFKRPVNAPSKKLRLRIPTPLMGHQYSDLKIELDPTNDLNTKITQHENFLQLEQLSYHPEMISIGYTASFTYRISDMPMLNLPSLTPEEHALYTNQSEGLISVTPKIKKIAQSLESSKHSEENILALWNWLLDNNMLGITQYHLLDEMNPMDWVLEHGVMDCLLGSALFISLCRSLGIPSRLIGGYTLYQAMPSPHYWAQVWLPDTGWTSYDFMSWDLSRGGTLKSWRGALQGQMEPRIIMEIFPQKIVGRIGIPFPTKHHRLISTEMKGTCIGYIDASSNFLIYKDTIEVLN